MGRPTVCTHELVSRMTALIARYGNVELCCARAGISKVSHYDWLAKGEEAEQANSNTVNGLDYTLYRQYMYAIKEAQAEFALDNLDVIREGKQGWQARSWLNERILPQHFSLRQTVEHSGTIATGEPTLSPAELKRKLAELGEDAVH